MTAQRLKPRAYPLIQAAPDLLWKNSKCSDYRWEKINPLLGGNCVNIAYMHYCFVSTMLTLLAIWLITAPHGHSL